MHVMPTSQKRRLRATDGEELAPSIQISDSEPGLESRPPHFPLRFAVPETVLRARPGPEGTLCTIKPEAACAFPGKESEDGWCRRAETLWAQEGLNCSPTDGAHFSLCLITRGRQRLQQGALPSATAAPVRR